jgi:hypothetical protein
LALISPIFVIRSDLKQNKTKQNKIKLNKL